MISSSSWSDDGLDCSVINGDADEADALVVASLRIGDNSIRSEGLSEFQLTGTRSAGVAAEAKTVAEGHLTWDAVYAEEYRPEFASVAPVRLILHGPRMVWSVGTVGAVQYPTPAYRRLTKIQVVAAAHRGQPSAFIRWDALLVRVITEGGKVGRLHVLPCLPQARSRAEPRRGKQSANQEGEFQRQFAEIPLPSVAIGVELFGQVSLRVDEAGAPRLKIGPDDLYSKVLVFAH